ncbi:MAG: hypothetical protein NC541_07900 [bacterium]|nr:hypothetical protein [bacterium]
MDLAIMVFVGGLCAYVAGKIFNSEERNQVFNKRPIEVVDVKKYNQLCGFLVIGFGVVVEITLFLSFFFGGLGSLIGTVAMLIEAFAVLKIYSKIEIKMLKKR